MTVSLSFNFRQIWYLNRNGSANAYRWLTKEKVLGLHIRINAPIDSVWSRWSTEKGVKKFFAPACKFEPKVLSLFEIHFAPAALKVSVVQKIIASLPFKTNK